MPLPRPKRTRIETLDYTNSARNTFLNCRRRYWYSYEERLAPRSTAMPLVLGSAFHDAMEVWYKGGSFAAGVNAAEDVFREARTDMVNENFLSKLEVGSSMMRGLLEAYFEKYIESDLARWKIVDVETVFHYPLIEGWRASGKLDLVVEEEDPGKILVEHKTTSILGEDYVERLTLDNQLHQYSLGMRAQYGEWPKAVVYNVVQKSRLRQKKTETFAQYCTRVKDDYLADPGRYFWRGRFTLPRWSLSRFQEEQLESLRQLIQARRRGREAFLMNTNHCYTYGACPFVALCTTDEDPGMRQALYDIVATPHPELEDLASFVSSNA